MKIDLKELVRKNISDLTAYSSARDEFSGMADIYLDANENSLGSPLQTDHSRYPDPLQREVRMRIAETWNIAMDNIFLGNGSDEAIDLLFRIFCRPGHDNVIICPPTYGMYEVCARINDVETKEVPLLPNGFELNEKDILAAVDESTKLIFICSPNNPTGNTMSRESIVRIADNFRGIVAVDEAYIDFSNSETIIEVLKEHKNIVVLQTFSKAWGLAGLRLGLAFADGEIVALMHKVKYPYNVSSNNQQLLLEALRNREAFILKRDALVIERERLRAELEKIRNVSHIYPSDANFLLVKFEDARGIYQFLIHKRIVVRDRSQVLYCDECLRITVGTPEENRQLISAIKEYEKSAIY